MSKDGKVHGFPDVGSKLNAAPKKSVFERQKAEAEAKRLKEQQETAAVYQDFIKAFDDEGSDDEGPRPGPTPEVARTAAPGSSLSKRHFSSNVGGPARSSKFSGPGSLGPPPSGFTRKRNYEGSPPTGPGSQGMRAFEESSDDFKNAFPGSDDENDKATSRAEERAKQKPTVHMSSLPPGTSPSVIRALMPSTLGIDGVRVLPPSMGGNGRQSISAIVTLAADTPASDLDTAVSSLQNRYLGRGFYLSISRHLSSAVLESNLPSSFNTTLPFGAKTVAPSAGRGQGPMRGRGGFAPPPSLTQRMPPPGRPTGIQVEVVPPSDLKQLKLIHKMIELVIKNGPEFEALLMSRPEVQAEERWAWLWDSRSAGGIWYRWRLWQILTAPSGRAPSQTPGDAAQYIFENSAPWVAHHDLPFEYVTQLDELVTDSDYNSSEDEDSGDEGRRRLEHLQGAMPSDHAPSGPDDGPAYLNPLLRAKLMHLLSRLPDSTAKLRCGDVARITAFAIQNAGTGAEEVVDLLTANVHTPFALESTPKNGNANDGEGKNQPMEDGKPSDEADLSAMKLIGLYLISDILSSSSTSGVRHAWRYRQLFETALAKKATFEHLGRLDKQLKWGRLRAEKWRRAIGTLFNMWEGWSVFTAAGHEAFVNRFAHPPLTAEEQAQVEKAEEEARSTEKSRSHWKTVAAKSDAVRDSNNVTEALEDVDGEAMDEDENLDGEPMEDEDEDDDEDEDMEKPSMGEGQQAGEAMDLVDEGAPAVDAKDTVVAEQPAEGTRRQRPRASDMFGDSDEE